MAKIKDEKLVIEAWPQLIEALDRHKMLGSTPAEVAKFLIVDGLFQIEQHAAIGRRARADAIASGWRGHL